MASYNYDETGIMALFFIITVLFMILVPVTLSQISTTSTKETPTASCECSACIDKRARVRKREKGSIFRLNLTKKSLFTILGWVAFGLLSYKVSTTNIESKIYDPFEILGISLGSTEKEIKSHFKKLSKQFHPDKVKLTGNDTAESVALRFVDITKAYKSLTDETIRKNFEDYGHPDGRQEFSMGIALPAWIVEAQNNIWVLSAYGLIFGLALPAIVGNWWFGSRQKTKDGVFSHTAASFWKALTETSDVDEIVSALSRAAEWQTTAPKGSFNTDALRTLEKNIEADIGPRWTRARLQFQRAVGTLDARWDSLVLLYAHLLRLPIDDAALQKRQTQVLLQTPTLLNALLNITMARNWTQPTVATMRLHAFLAQAILPGSNISRWSQLPGLKNDEIRSLQGSLRDFGDVVSALEDKGNALAVDARKATERWGRVELVDAAFKVIGERIVTPQALVHLVVKLRVKPPKASSGSTTNGAAKLETRSVVDADEEERLDEEFLNSPKDTEDLKTPIPTLGSAHAPLWPANHKPGWWIVLADAKIDRLVVPPIKVTDVPFADPSRARDYRSYKLKFQAPSGTGVFTWRIIVVSDTYIGEDASQDIQLRVEEFTELTADEQHRDDEISDPEEDSLAGQMAAMRGGSVKKRSEESDDESSTDDDEVAANDSSSDSD
ncbi:Sec63 Brl domain-containing protein [Gloeopeniophorella convolvens]|nr:Sec63 Brl domain-containing protein [Gloeopeniophorella convolvens]